MEQRTIKPNKLINNIPHYTMPDAAAVLGMSVKTLKRKMEHRLIEYVALGRDKLFPATSVDEYYRRHVVHTKQFLKGVER